MHPSSSELTRRLAPLAAALLLAADPSGYVFATDASQLGFIIPEAFTDSVTTEVSIDGVTAAAVVRFTKAVAKATSGSSRFRYRW